MTSLPLHFRSWICRQPDGCSGRSLVERQKACQGALQLLSPDDQRNVIQFSGQKSDSCAHAERSIVSFLNQLVSVLTYPGQVVIEMFPETACGMFCGCIHF